ncbi:MAG: transposase [Gammaproteobacteria bacterium]
MTPRVSGFDRDLVGGCYEKKRGLRTLCLVVGDGNLGLWGALSQVYPEAEEQQCWNHRIINILDKLPEKRQLEAKALLCHYLRTG